MLIDLSFLTPYVPLLPVLLPVVITFIAGLLRQDGLPKQANEGITIALVLAAAVVNAIYNKALSNNALLDFIIVVGYMTTIIRLPVMQDLQQYLQSNWLTILKASAGALAHAPAQPDPALVAAVAAQVQTQMDARYKLATYRGQPKDITLTPPNRLTGG